MEVVGVVLAAGAGRRYGTPKALVQYRGQPLVRHVADIARDGGCTRTVVVVGAEAARVRSAAPGLLFVDNPDWRGGMGSSLRAGLAAAAQTPAVAALVLLVDMPGVTLEAVRRVAGHAAPGALVMGGYGARRGHPVLLGRDHWSAVAASATGDRGAREYLRTHADTLTVVPVADVANDVDIDTVDAWARFVIDGQQD